MPFEREEEDRSPLERRRGGERGGPQKKSPGGLQAILKGREQPAASQFKEPGGRRTFISQKKKSVLSAGEEKLKKATQRERGRKGTLNIPRELDL